MGGMTQRLALLTFELARQDKAVRLLPAGEFRSADGSGRPADVPAWRIDAALAAKLIARANARADRKVVDYEHQTLKASDNGQPAPAAGWIAALEWREPSGAEPGGLYMTTDWTEKAAAMIAAREYRYISPVFSYDRDGNVTDLLHAGLTNFAGLDGLTDLAALSAHFFPHHNPPPQAGEGAFKETRMKKLIEALGLAADASEDQALAALKALTDAHAAQAGTIAALKAQAPDLSRYVPMETHVQTQNALAALTAKVEQDERDLLVEAALSDGRILPAQEEYWRAQPVASLKAYLEVAQPVAALSGTQTGGKQPGGKPDDGGLDEGQLAVCRALGVSPEDFAKNLKV